MFSGMMFCADCGSVMYQCRATNFRREQEYYLCAGYRKSRDFCGQTHSIIINDYRRGRLTGGVTLSFLKLFASDIRINYEKYFYRAGAVPKASEKDKIVIEFMTRF